MKILLVFCTTNGFLTFIYTDHIDYIYLRVLFFFSQLNASKWCLMVTVPKCLLVLKYV